MTRPPSCGTITSFTEELETCWACQPSKLNASMRHPVGGLAGVCCEYIRAAMMAYISNKPSPRRTVRLRSTTLALTRLEPSEFLHRFLDGFEFFDVGVHGVLLEIQLLCECKNLCRFGARNDNDTVCVRNNDVGRLHFNAVADDRNVGTGEAVMTDGSGRHNPQGVHRESDLLQVSDVAHPTVDDRTGKFARRHRGTH